MTMPWYASAEQVMRDRSEYARKGIARGRSVVVLTYVDGVVFVAENPSTALHKVSEIYDRIGFAAVGRYNEYDNLRTAGVRYADLRGYSYDRRDVSGRALANVYSQTLGAIFTEQQKPFEVEICVAEVGDDADGDQLYRLSYDGSIVDESAFGFVVMGGQAEAMANTIKSAYRKGMPLAEAVTLAVRALSSVGENGKRQLAANQLEVAVLDRTRTQARKFKRITEQTLERILSESRPDTTPSESTAASDSGAKPADDTPVAPPEDDVPVAPPEAPDDNRPL
jgi:proteasome alpha subunit